MSPEGIYKRRKNVETQTQNSRLESSRGDEKIKQAVNKRGV